MIHLTGQNLSAKETIQHIFSPLVGAIVANQAEELCLKNNLTFVELLQPFLKLSADAHFRDSAGTSVSVKGLRINICDVNWRPPQTILAKKMLNEAVTSAQCEKIRSIKISEELKMDIPVNELWFEQWRETFLTVQFPSDHEFTRHLLCSLVVVASLDPNPVETATQLTKKLQMMQNITPPKLPKWFSTDTLNCYVMLHDGCSGDISKVQQAFEALRSSFGEQKCFLLQINSHHGSPSEKNPDPDPWLRYLKRNQRIEPTMENDSAPKTPQDMGAVTGMPSALQVNNTIEVGPIPMGDVVAHPLSPVQETGVEIQETTSLSASVDSLTTQTINPNVWTHETDIDVPHGSFLIPADIDNLKHFIQDFAVRALIPYVERIVGLLNDSISNKKGVSRTLFSATKRWFTNKPGASTAQNAVVYTAESTELQTRKLGDLYFMFGHYNLAYQAYYQAKRDFMADSAWQYYAGALEMAALSTFMQGTPTRKSYDYMEESITTYLNICKMPQFATRATLLSMECLKAAKHHNEAAKQLIRMTSEDSDLRSALLLEQAAYCYLLANPPLYRKYAFHSVLAGHRYSKSGQRKHSFRTYRQAYQVFENRGWSLAEDHIQYTIGRQAINLKKLDEAIGCLAHLLRPSSLQSAAQQTLFLREYLATTKALLMKSESTEIVDISIPKIIQNSTKVLVTSQPPVANPKFTPATNININSSLTNDSIWNKMEEMLVQTAAKKQVMIFKLTKSLFTCEVPTIDQPLSVHGEPIDICFTLENTIKPPISFENINLLWEFRKESGEVCSNKLLFTSDSIGEDRKDIENIVTSTTMASLQFNEYEKKSVTLRVTPRLIGQLKILGVVGKVTTTVHDAPNLWGKHLFKPIPIKSNAKDKTPTAFDKKLEIEILPPAPALHVSFSQTPSEVLAGEIIPITVNLTNAGVSVLNDIYICIENPRFVLVNPEVSEIPLSILRDLKDLTNENLGRDKETRKQYVFKAFQRSEDNFINPKETKVTKIWLQATYKKGPKNVKLLIYYAMPQEYPKLKYRLVRHTWNLNVNESLMVEANCNITHGLNSELGVDLNIKNMNQMHHPLMTEITVNEVALYCSSFEMNPNRVVYMKNPGYRKMFVEKNGLKSNEMINFRCHLNQRHKEIVYDGDFLEYIRGKLSSILLREDETCRKHLPELEKLGSFLMKHETKFINAYDPPNTEEFNALLSTLDRHMTICVNWTAKVYDNASSERLAYGQHFVQLRHFYEPIFCPPSDRVLQTSFSVHEKVYGIYENLNEIFNKPDLEEDGWAVNNVCVSQRCFLEEEIKVM